MVCQKKIHGIISKTQKKASSLSKGKKPSSSSQVYLDPTVSLEKNTVIDDDSSTQPQAEKKVTDVNVNDQNKTLFKSDVDDVKSFVKTYVRYFNIVIFTCYIDRVIKI